LIQSHKIVEKKKFLNETNDLLKKFGSTSKIRNPEDDMSLKIRTILQDMFLEFFPKKESAPVEKKIDTQSFIFFKNLRELNLYKEKLTATNKDLLKATLLFQKEKVVRLKIKKKLIIQNIQLIEKRIKNIKFSYTSIVN
jgi:hypothetical protein